MSERGKVSERLQPHDQIARAEPQTLARRDFEAAVCKRVEKGAPTAMSIAVRADADNEAGER